MLLYYIRHGDPIYDPDCLTPLGQKQAEAVAKRLALNGIDEIYSSSSNRAVCTARPTSELVGRPVNILDWCNENYAWQELSVTDDDGSRKWFFHIENYRKLFVSQEMLKLGLDWHSHEQLKDTVYPRGIGRIKRETYKLLSSLGYEHDEERCLYKAVSPNEKRVALFAHEGFGLAFLSAVLDIPYPVACTRFALSHSLMTVIRFEGAPEVIPCMLQLSNDSHIYKEGLPTKYFNQFYV